MKVYISRDEYDDYPRVVDPDKYRGPNAAPDSWRFYIDEPPTGDEEAELDPALWEEWIYIYRRYDELQSIFGDLHDKAKQERKFGAELGRYNK